MKTLALLVLAAFSLPALAAGEDARARAGANASVEGGATLGDTGINSGALGRGIDLNRPAPGMLRVPTNRRDRDDRASTGSSRPVQQATDLGGEAEREEDAIRHKMRER